MNKYIEAEVLKNNIHNCIWTQDMKSVEKFVNGLPAADVVEVVRCKDCCKYPAEKTTNRQASYNAAVSDACRIIDAIPADDVVKVCRCEYCSKSTEHLNGRWCKIHQTMTQNTDYCSWGTKK